MASIARFFKWLFGQGPDETQQTVIELCARSDSAVIDEAEFRRIAAALEVDQDTPGLGPKLKSIRNSVIEHISGIYAKEGLHPWLRMFLASSKSASLDAKLPVNNFLDKFYTHRDAGSSDKLRQDATLDQVERLALELLGNLKGKAIRGLAGQNQRLASDFEARRKGVPRPGSALEKDYLSVVLELNSLFESISESVRQARQAFTDQFAESLRQFVDEVVNPEIARNMYVSQLNEKADILTGDNLISLRKMFDIALATGLMQTDSRTEVRIGFKFLDLAYYQQRKRSTLI